jgi:hypothetical protein
MCFFHLPYHIKTEKRIITMKVSNPSQPYLLVKGNPLSCIGVLIKKESLIENKFNENRSLSGSEDWEFWLRLYAKYGLISEHKISACLINHHFRSVFAYPENTLVQRKNISISSAFKDKDVSRVFSPFKKTIYGYWDAYISLHLVIANQKTTGLKYLFKALKAYPQIIFEKRFFAIVKNFFL